MFGCQKASIMSQFCVALDTPLNLWVHLPKTMQAGRGRAGCEPNPRALGATRLTRGYTASWD